MTETKNYIKINASLRGLQKFLGKLYHSTSEDETRWYLNGVCFERKDGILLAASTDGYRMTVIDIVKYAKIALGIFEVIDSADKDFEVIVPNELISLVLNLPLKNEIEDGEDSYEEGKGFSGSERVSFVLDSTCGNIVFEDSKIKTTFDYINDTFVDYRKAIPEDTEKVGTFNANYLIDIAKAAGNIFCHYTLKQNKEKGHLSPTIIQNDAELYVIMPAKDSDDK